MLGLSLIFFNTFANAQNGLENIIVEKYYISDAHDASATSGGYLPKGSVTYRIYADMLPAYRFQAAYGVPGHDLRFATTTTFFNNESYGASVANDINKNALKYNTVMLDSWLSVAAASAGNFGISKEEDNDLKTIVNEDGLLQNKDANADLPLSKRDGLLEASPQLAVTFYGIDSNLLALFGNQNFKTKEQEFFTNNGSWASIGGSVGPDEKNKVLIAQITTDGDFSFELNIQIGKPTGGAENYVARNPVGNEIQLASLTYSSRKAK